MGAMWDDKTNKYYGVKGWHERAEKAEAENERLQAERDSARATVERLRAALEAIANTEMESYRWDDIWWSVRQIARDALDLHQGGAG